MSSQVGKVPDPGMPTRRCERLRPATSASRWTFWRSWRETIILGCVVRPLRIRDFLERFRRHWRRPLFLVRRELASIPSTVVDLLEKLSMDPHRPGASVLVRYTQVSVPAPRAPSRR